ncbi:MAG: DUF1580 domain-containing protein [Planctomycetota bacterium]
MSTTLHDRLRLPATIYEIDPTRDRLVSMRRVPGWFTAHVQEPLHRSAPYRWARQGIRGIRLPTVRIGGRRYTSEEAIAWWTAALTATGEEKTVVAGAPTEAATVAEQKGGELP